MGPGKVSGQLGPCWTGSGKLRPSIPRLSDDLRKNVSHQNGRVFADDLPRRAQIQNPSPICGKDGSIRVAEGRASDTGTYSRETHHATRDEASLQRSQTGVDTSCEVEGHAGSAIDQSLSRNPAGLQPGGVGFLPAG